MAIEIRFARPDDADGIRAIYAPYCESSTVSFEIVAPTKQQMRERIEQISAQYPWLVCEIDGEMAGYVYACQHRERAAYRWGVDTAVYVARRHQRRRVGQALYHCLFEILRRQNYRKAYAGITLPNDASVGLHEAVGFRRVALFPGEGFKFGAWRDVGWWELRLGPEVDDPPEPVAIGTIQVDAAVTAALAAAGEAVQPAP